MTDTRFQDKVRLMDSRTVTPDMILKLQIYIFWKSFMPIFKTLTIIVSEGHMKQECMTDISQAAGQIYTDN